MSSNNDNGAAMGMAVVFTILAFVGLFLYALLLFVSFVLTILCIVAWNNPLRLGKLTIEPREAHAFVARGLFGMAALPFFAAFCSTIFDVPIDPEFWSHLVVGGYALGSLGVEIMMAEDQPRTMTPAWREEPQRPVEVLPPQKRAAVRDDPSESVRFASWDDEDEMR